MKGLAFCILMALMICIFFVVPLLAVENEVTTSWDYKNPPSDLSCFELRLNEDNSTMISIPGSVRVWQGVVSLLDDNNTAEIRAVDLSGQHSAWTKSQNTLNPAPPGGIVFKWLLVAQP